MMLFASKCEAMSQSVFGKNAVGVPCSRVSHATVCLYDLMRTQLSVSIEEPPAERSDGGLPFRGKNQTLMKLLVRSMAYHPPPMAFSEGP